VLNHKFAS